METLESRTISNIWRKCEMKAAVQSVTGPYLHLRTVDIERWRDA
jgi:hypothetical protein